MQTIQTIAKDVGHLTVFQRTPNWCAPLHNSKIDAETQKTIKAGYPEMFRRCQETFACFVHTPDKRGTFEVSDEAREAFFQKLYAEPGFGIWQGNFRDILTDRKAICGERYPQLVVGNSFDMLAHSAVLAALGDGATSDAVFNALRFARMQVPSPALKWVTELIGPERAAMCECLPRAFRARYGN